MDNLDVKTPLEGAPAAEAETENENSAQTLGKFKDVKTLLNAYESLQAEFTRRSQRLKELENANKSCAPPENSDNGESCLQNADSALSGKGLLAAALASSEVKEAVIGQYLKSVTQNRGVPLIVDGQCVPTPKFKVSSVVEAGCLAKEFLLKGFNA